MDEEEKIEENKPTLKQWFGVRTMAHIYKAIYIRNACPLYTLYTI